MSKRRQGRGYVNERVMVGKNVRFPLKVLEELREWVEIYRRLHKGTFVVESDVVRLGVTHFLANHSPDDSLEG